MMRLGDEGAGGKFHLALHWQGLWPRILAPVVFENLRILGASPVSALDFMCELAARHAGTATPPCMLLIELAPPDFRGLP